MIPAEAVEAALAANLAYKSQRSMDNAEKQMRAVLEAAAPYMLRHEREQTRLAHLDAMVNRKTKRSELAEAWEQGYMAGPYENPYCK